VVFWWYFSAKVKISKLRKKRNLNYLDIIIRKRFMNILRPLSKEELNNFFSEHSLKVIQYFMNISLFLFVQLIDM
jgi:ABC-type oligopeptide transport system ATPase subunit